MQWESLANCTGNIELVHNVSRLAEHSFSSSRRYTTGQDSRWLSQDVLAKVNSSNINLTLRSNSEFRETLAGNIQAEADAAKLAELVLDSEAKGEMLLSQKFKCFLSHWLEDELNHAYGFAYLDSLLGGAPANDRLDAARQVKADFSGLKNTGFLKGEFELCVLIAYDEICSAKAYQLERSNGYQLWSHPDPLNWISLVARDEAYHLRNVVAVLKELHKDRLAEFPELLLRLRTYDENKTSYEGTFVLDHTDKTLYQPHFFDFVSEKLLKIISVT